MRVGYVDTSCLVAIALEEPGARAVRRRLDRLSERVTSNLVEAELRAALRREGLDDHTAPGIQISWILPDRPLTPEITRVLATGYVRGADCWHLATALYLAPEPEELVFLTLDQRQKRVASGLGFRT